MLKQDEPVTVTSNRLDYDGAASQAKYMGVARLSRADTEVQADAIELDDETGNLTARGTCAPKMMLDDVDPKTKAAQVDPRRPATADAFRLRGRQAAGYLHVDRRAPRTSSARPATSPATSIDLYLKEDGRARTGRGRRQRHDDRQNNGRTAKGQHLTYTAADDTYVMTGSPVEVVRERADNNCKKTLARCLRFQRAVDNDPTTEGSPVDDHATSRARERD